LQRLLRPAASFASVSSQRLPPDTAPSATVVDDVYRLVSIALSLTLVGLGIAMIVLTLVRGSGTLGIILGPMFVAAGAGRLYVTRLRSG